MGEGLSLDSVGGGGGRGGAGRSGGGYSGGGGGGGFSINWGEVPSSSSRNTAGGGGSHPTPHNPAYAAPSPSASAPTITLGQGGFSPRDPPFGNDSQQVNK